MNKLEKVLMEKNAEKLTENGDVSYNSTGDNMLDLFFLTAYFEKHLDEVNIGTSEKEQLLSMFIRDPRYGLGRRDLGRRLMSLSKVSAQNIVKAGRYDDLVYIPTDSNLEYLKEQLYASNELAKKWLPRLTGKDKRYAKILCKMWGITEKEYRKLIKTDTTVEYKLSYAEKIEGTPLNDLFNKGNYAHPLVDTIDFEKVPSLAMLKYWKMFSTREDIKARYEEYMKKVSENKAKINTSTANVYDAYKVAADCWVPQCVDTKEVIANKIVEDKTLGVEMNAICILDTSGSMEWDNLIDKAYALAYGLAIKSTYAPNQVISFSSQPQLITIHGNTLQEKYRSMYTGDCSNTDFGKVMQLLKKLQKYPEYLIVISDMEFDSGSCQSKKETMQLFKDNGANTKIIWWNLNDRNKTVPEMDEYGNIYMSGYNLQMLKLLDNKFNMNTYLDNVLEKYKKDIDFQL